MKRAKKTIKKRTYSMKGAIPVFVSLVDRGANFTPLSTLRYGENESFGQDVEINRIVFSKSIFGTSEAVSNYLKENNYEEFAVAEEGDNFVVSSFASDEFEEVQELEYEDGVKFYVGKLKEATGEVTPAAEVTEAVEQHEEFSEEKTEEVQEVTVEEASEEIVQESQEEKVEDEEANETIEEASSEESGEGFSADAEEVQEEVTETVSEEVIAEFSQNDRDELLAKVEALEAKLAAFEEKFALIEQKQEETIDEEEVLIQNSQSVQHDEIINDDSTQVDEAAERFSQKRTNDLFGLRG